MIARTAQVPRNVAREWRMAWPPMSDKRSFFRYGTDAVLYRGLMFAPSSDRLRTIRIRGTNLTYRLQRGDIQAVREVWVEEAYRPPVKIPFNTVVDLGTNIGLTTLWYAVHGASRLRCVEPLAANLALARHNLAQNGFSAELVQAAVGPADGTARFHADPRYSTRGHLDEAGELEVRVLSMPTLLADLDEVDLLKVDVEGAEIALFRGELSWLAKVNAIIIEFDRGDPRELAPVIEAQGFRYLPVSSVWWNSMDFFVRE